MTIATEPTSNFQGATDAAPSSTLLGKRVVDAKTKRPRASTDLPSADAELASAYARFMATGSAASAAELTRGVQDRLTATRRFERMATAVTGGKKLLTDALPAKVDDECHFKAHKAYIAKCGEWTTGSLKHSADLAKMCAATKGDAQPIVAAINQACAA